MDSDYIKKLAYSFGADVCGIGSLDRFKAAPKGFHPLEDRYSEHFGFLEEEVEDLLEYKGIAFEIKVVNEDIEVFEHILREFVIKSVSYFDTDTKNENMRMTLEGGS